MSFRRRSRSPSAIQADLALAELASPCDPRKVVLLRDELRRALRYARALKPSKPKPTYKVIQAKAAARDRYLADRDALNASLFIGLQDRPEEALGGPVAVFGRFDLEFEATAKALFATQHTPADEFGHQIWTGAIGIPVLRSPNGKTYRNPLDGLPVIAMYRGSADTLAGVFHHRLYCGEHRGFVPVPICNAAHCVSVDHWRWEPMVFSETDDADRS